MAAQIQLSIITATWQRPKSLAGLLASVSRQSLGNLKIEHIVVSDGPDAVTSALLNQSATRYLELESNQGNFGAAAKDLGIRAAKGEYVCIWDDDNLYEPHAASALFSAASGFDLGIVQAEHWSVTRKRYVTIPADWDGTVKPGQIDTMCLCVRKSVAEKSAWHQPPQGRGTDHRWLSRLLEHQPTVHFVPVTIGKHLTF